VEVVRAVEVKVVAVRPAEKTAVAMRAVVVATDEERAAKVQGIAVRAKTLVKAVREVMVERFHQAWRCGCRTKSWQSRCVPIMRCSWSNRGRVSPLTLAAHITTCKVSQSKHGAHD